MRRRTIEEVEKEKAHELALAQGLFKLDEDEAMGAGETMVDLDADAEDGNDDVRWDEWVDAGNL